MPEKATELLERPAAEIDAEQPATDMADRDADLSGADLSGADSGAAAADDVVAADLLVEEISIDGMCGVY